MKLKGFKENLEQRLDRDEIKKLEALVKLEAESLQMLRHDITAAIAKHIEENGIGFNEFTRQLGVSPSHAAKIRNGKANLTMSSIAHIAAFLGKKPHLIFD